MKTSSMKEAKDLCMTVYNEGFGLISERRTVDLDGSDDRLQYLDVAQRIEIESLRVDGIDISEVNYEYDLVDKVKLLGKYVGEEVIFVHKGTGERKACRLLAAQGLILEAIATGEVLVEPQGELVLAKLPEGLSARPALVFQLKPSRSHDIGVSYLTQGLSWTTNYVVEMGEANMAIDAWVELTNQSGMTYENARLKLLAGEVNRVEEPLYDAMQIKESLPFAMDDHEFVEKSFADYHLYTLQGRTTLKDNQSKQVRLFGTENVAYKKYYEVASWTEDARIVMEFQNSKENSLGVPFPAGKIKVYQRDTGDDGLAFVGEDQIDHTPKDKSIRVMLGEAFDLRCQRKCLGRKNNQGVREESWRITVENHKDEPSDIRVNHRLPAYAEIGESSHPWERVSADEIQFRIHLNAGAAQEIMIATNIDERVHVVKESRE